MKIKVTNRMGLPQPVVEAVQNDDYDVEGCDYTPSSLLTPVRIRALVRMFPDDCIEDVADLMPCLFGQAVHNVLERAAQTLEPEGYIVEKRFKALVSAAGRTFVVGAKIDLYDRTKEELTDYKTCSSFAVQYGPKDEHKLQLNLQRFLMMLEGVVPRSLKIVAMLKDWSKRKAEQSDYYPPSPTVSITHKLMPATDVISWVKERIEAHEAARAATSQAQLPLCTDEETWARTDDDKFAVMKPGAKRASKLCGSEAEAAEYVASRLDEGLVVEKRYGEAVRCDGYCPARHICEQWKTSLRNPANSLPGSEETAKARSVMENIPDEFERI